MLGMLNRVQATQKKAAQWRRATPTVATPRAARHLRPEQLPPLEPWAIWLILAGRGFGKTLTGASWLASQARVPDTRWAIIAPTIADARDTMIEGVTGLLSVLAPSELRGSSVDSAWNRSMGELHLANGSQIKAFSSEKPGRLRGPQHHGIWGDEPAEWRDAGKGMGEDTTISNALFGLRLGLNPQFCLTGTPKPKRLMRELLKDPRVNLTRGKTDDNKDNLPDALRANLERYRGTRLGRQELDGELLEDVVGALWQPVMFDAEGFRLEVAPALKRIVVAIDPGGSGKDQDETGLIVAGLGFDNRGYVLADITAHHTPNGWASAAVDAYQRWRADRIIAERNHGGDMVENTITTLYPGTPITTVWASRGKYTRAEPISALYEQNLISHVGSFPELEAELTGWDPSSERSPNRLDALVWAFTDLKLDPVPELLFGRA